MMALPIFAAISGIAKSIHGVGVSKAKAFTGAIRETANTIKQSGIDAILEGLVGLFKPFIKLLDGINIVFKVLGGHVQAALAPAMGKFFEILTSPEIMKALEIVGTAIGNALVPAMEFLGLILKKLVDSGVFEILANAFAQIAGALGEVMVGVINALIDSGLLDLLINFFVWVAQAFADFVTWLLDTGIVDFIIWFAETMVKYLMLFIQEIGPYVQAFAEWFGGIMAIFGEWLHGVLPEVFEWLINLFSVIYTIFIGAVMWLIEDLPGVIMGLFEWIWNVFLAGLLFLGQIGHTIGSFFVGIWDAIVGVFKWIADGITGAWNVVVNALKAFVNGLIWVVNQIIGVINIVVGLFSLGQAQIPSIPYLETGGSIERTGVAVVHAGEQVMNVETVQALHSLLDQMSTQGRAIENKTNTINISAQAFDDAGIEKLAREVYKQQLLFD